MARFKPGTFSVHFFFFCSCLTFSFSFETCLSYWLFPNAFLLPASQAWLPFSFCLFLLLLLPHEADASVKTHSHKSHQRLTLRVLHGQRKRVASTQQTAARSERSQPGRGLTLQTGTCLLMGGGFLSRYIGKALLRRSLLLLNHQCSC